MTTAEAVKRGVFVAAVLSLVWAACIRLFGGFEVTVLGVTLRSFGPGRPLRMGLAAIALFVWLHGIRQTAGQLERMIGRVDHRLAVAALTVWVAVAGLWWGTFVAGGSDSYGYVSQADLWLKGQLSIPQPWITRVPWPDAARSFAPLGYVPDLTQAAIVPTYPPGLPLLMAAAKWVGGECGVYGVVPSMAALLILATYGLGGRLHSSGVGLAAAWLVATSPVVLFMVTAPMTDVPVAACWTVAFYLLLRPGPWSAAGAGLAGGLAAMIRPNLAPMCGLLVLWYVIRAWGGDRTRPGGIPCVFAVVLGLVPGAVTIAVFNWSLYGSPFLSGYGPAANYYSWSYVLPNVRNYASWLLDVQTPLAFAGLAALLLPVRRVWPRVEHRSFVVMAALFVAGIWAQYCLFNVFDAWWYLRFLLPCWPFIMIGTARALGMTLRPGRSLVTLGVIALVFGIGLRGVSMAVDRGSFDLWKGERKYATVAGLVRSATDDQSVVVSMQHSGSLRYYGGRVTLRDDYLDPARLDRDLGWLADHGAHAYALLEEWELKAFKDRFAGAASLARLREPPVFVYRGSTTVYLFDLQASQGPARAPRTVVETFEGPRCPRPRPLPDLVFK